MTYRLGFDMGSNSLGWCAVRLDSDGEPIDVLDAGVRILTPNDEAGKDPQSKASLAANRREKRSARKRRDRFLRRQQRLMELLIKHGLMPQDKTARKELEKLDPYVLRAEGVTKPLPPHEFGRALFHINQRRGFKSNRITDADDTEKGAVAAGNKALQEALESEETRPKKTLGQFLAERHNRDRYGKRTKDTVIQPVRFRPRTVGSKNLYDLYPTRQMTEEEIDRLWEKQSQTNPALTDDLLTKIKRVIVDQRPLEKPLVGKCTFNPKEDRAPRALPLFQRYRILTETANLIVELPGVSRRPISKSEQKLLVGLLCQRASTVDFTTLRKALKLPDEATFNLEHGKRKGLDPDLTAARLANKNILGKAWREIPIKRQNEIVKSLLNEEDEAKLISWLTDEMGFDEETATKMSGARLPQGHGHLGETILGQLVEVLETDSTDCPDPQTGEIYARPLTYDEAVKSIGHHHSDMSPNGLLAELPYYGDILPRHVIQNPDAPETSQDYRGRVPNPTVHIALNQLRQVLNCLIRTYGPPAAINIELARGLKQSQKQKDEQTKANRQNEKARDEYRKILDELGMPDTHGNMLLLRLFHELPPDGRICVYSGTSLSMAMLTTGEVEIDHILPRSRTLDDSFMNKVLCTRAANREKGNRAPAEAWSGQKLAEIHARAKLLLPKKAWRFAPDAMERFEREGGFLEKQLKDTQHMSRLAKTYLEHVCKDVFATPGRLTAMLRGKWGLNRLLHDHNLHGDEAPKQRNDHRHHAIDAFVIACTTRSLLNRLSAASARAESLQLDRFAPSGEFPDPFDGFREQLKARLDTMIISHKPDHGIEGQLHEETAYGVVDEEIDGKRFNLVVRKNIDSLTEKMVWQVRDQTLREDLIAVVEEAKYATTQEYRDTGQKISANDVKKAIATALADYGQRHNIRRVRVLMTKQGVRVIEHGPDDLPAYKKYNKAYVPGGNYKIEFYEHPSGKLLSKNYTYFDANRMKLGQKNGNIITESKQESEARLLVTLHKGDTIEACIQGRKGLFIVRKLDPTNNRIYCVPQYYAGKVDDKIYIQVSFSKFREYNLKRVNVDPIGRFKYREGS